MGYSQAGFTEIVGVDIVPQPNYPFTFIQGDALAPPVELGGFDLIHASPPCQAYSIATVQLRAAGVEYLNAVASTRALLETSGRSWIMENVPGSPLHHHLVLCGSMFGLPMLRRHRWFEIPPGDRLIMSPPCMHDGTPTLSVTGHGVGAGNGQRQRIKEAIGHNPGIADARAAMDIDWMTRDELSEAIPPAYTKFIGEQFLAQ